MFSVKNISSKSTFKQICQTNHSRAFQRTLQEMQKENLSTYSKFLRNKKQSLKKKTQKQIKNQQYVILMVANGVAHFCIRWCPHFYFTDYGVLKKMAHLVFPLLILTFKKLLKSEIFISPQGKTLGRDLYMAFPLVKHLLYVHCRETA